MVLLYFWPRKERNGFDGGLAPVHNTFITLPWLVLLSVSECKWWNFAARDKCWLLISMARKEAGSHGI